MSLKLSQEQIQHRIRFENSWWKTSRIESFYAKMKEREYFKLFYPIAVQKEIKRAVVLLGPRRVGKTVMIFHTIQKLISEGIEPKRICYFSIETPIYNGIALEELLNEFLTINSLNPREELYVFFDEIQYLKNWEIHLKSLVDSYHNLKFVVSGSAAAALKLKSNESGAGRFTDFLLPPLTFHEYLVLRGLDDIVQKAEKIEKHRTTDDEIEYVANVYSTKNMEEFNKLFVDYINYGGYPEVSLSETIQSDPSRYLKNDIIDKVLLRDLPSLYGIEDIQELNSLFTYIAYNTGREMSLDEICQNSGVAKNTIKKYLTYLEAAFLINIIQRVDNNAKKFKRANFFKIYLSNPSLRAALFGPIAKDNELIGNLVETAIFSQWNHHNIASLYYARWNDGEVDIVHLNNAQKPDWAVEIKWSNRFAANPSELKNLKYFCEKNGLTTARVTTLDVEKNVDFNGIKYVFMPNSLYCYGVGANSLINKGITL